MENKQMFICWRKITDLKDRAVCSLLHMTSSLNKILLSFCAVVLISSCKQNALPRPTMAAEKIDNFLAGEVDRLSIPGLTVSIVRNDSLIYSGAFGFKNVTTKEPLKTTSIFHWASVSKTFVATAIMQLVEQGKIDLDAKLVTYIPFFKQRDSTYKEITIRQMLNHTSGIGDVDDYEWDDPQYDDAALEKFVRSIRHDRLAFPPGKDWAYSNTAYETLGLVISRVSGMPFETYIRKNILDPLEMNQTSFIYPEIPDSLRVQGHVWGGKPLVSGVYPYNRMHAPSSTLNSNVIEMTHYAMAHLHRGQYKDKRILSDSTYDLLWTNSVTIPDAPQIGLAWWLKEHEGIKTVSHAGGDTGFRSYFMLIPDKNLAIMLVSNYELLRSEDIALAILDILVDKKPKPIKRQIGFKFAEILIADGLQKAKEFYQLAKADSTQQDLYFWQEDEAVMTYAGYLLINHKKYKEAIEVFKFNVELFPDSGHALGHLGVAYIGAGDTVQARANLKRAIKLVPDEAYFVDKLRSLDN
jgi:CubicO group peptidase (beta-lactamase class C family)